MKIYSPEERKQILRDAAASGRTFDEYGKSIKVHPQTLYSWKKRYGIPVISTPPLLLA